MYTYFYFYSITYCIAIQFLHTLSLYTALLGN